MAKRTFKIDRLSNNSLELGLRTNAILTGSASSITSSKILSYDSDFTSQIVTDNIITNKKYVDTAIDDLNTEIVNFIKNYIIAGDRITLDKTESTVTVKLGNAYDDGASKTFESDDSKQVISAISVDQYGTVTSVQYKTISTADLDNTGTDFDNYQNWQLKIGSATANIESAWRAEGDEDPVVPLEFASDGSIGLTLTDSSSHLVTMSLNVNPEEDYPLYVDSGTGLNLRTITGLENGKSLGFYKIAVDKFGRVISTASVVPSDITSILPVHSATTDGIVKHIDTSASGNSTSSPEDGTSTYFYTSNAKWTNIPYDKVNMALASGTGTVQILGTTSTTPGLTTVVSNNKLIFSPDSGILTATGFVGNGSGLTNISASAIEGTLNQSAIPSLDQNKINLGLASPGSVLYTNSSNKLAEVLNPSVPLESTNFVLTKPVQADGSGISNSPQWIDIKSLVTTIVAGEGGLTFQGTIGSSSDGGQYQDIPTSFNKGYFYKVVTTGTYIGQLLEKGDTIYAIKNSDTAYESADDTTKRTYWSVLQGNLDNAVTFNSVSTVTNGILPIKAAGQAVISDATGLSASKTGDSWLLGTDISGNAATASKLSQAITIWGQSFDGTSPISGNLTSVGNIIPDGTDKEIGSTTNPFNKAYITEVIGNLTGVASSASKVTSDLIIGGKHYNGSEEVTINLSASDLGLISNVSVVSDGEGNAITSLDANNSGGIVTLTATKQYLISNITSDLFNISTTGGVASINILTSEKEGAIFKSSNPIPSLSTTYGFGGVLTATDLRVIRDGLSKKVATLGNGTDTSPSGKKLLVADSAASDYGFIKTQISVEANPTWTSDIQVPTANAVNNKVAEVQAAVTTGSSRYIRLNLTNSSVTSVTSIPSGGYIHEIHVRVKSAYSASSTLSINVGNTTYVATTDIDLSTAGDTFTYVIDDDTASGGNVVANLTVSDDTIGALAVTVVYVSSFNS